LRGRETETKQILRIAVEPAPERIWKITTSKKKKKC